MPIEIRELIIRTSVSKASSDEGGEEKSGGLSEEQVAQVVQECVRQVLRILRQEQER